ncbi:thymidylate synthase [Beijerinckia indica]|uniref:thymidylate synthase n=1 Tax=Beijerinckia indica subsp. indica (strain ATCC 9039 / DSM 1715 / NCIMB 8712) TaxID=395963 RepID=B2IB94_BEII9|nr:thymidylate synthase [Beijerinckia indica]ACB95178.1 thymidylate synthase [Beijerinckia indica subsp. indica ATCC 9039]
MEIEKECLDAILYNLYWSIKEHGRTNAGSRGNTVELLGVALRILKPRARISRSENRGKPFSAIGELLWYLSGLDTLAFIEPYVSAYRDDAVAGVIQGAYGPRLRAMRDGIDQFASIETLLRQKPNSRRAVIQLFNAEDIATEHKEIPCTTTLQFHLRDGLLHMSVTMRSNDAYWGLPHDVFCFTMIQEMMARRLGVELGEYYHYVGSMHVYEKHLNHLDNYLVEGFQRTAEMPPMPAGDPFQLVDHLLSIEGRLRRGDDLNAGSEISDPYWADIVRLMQVFWAREFAHDHPARLMELRAQLETSFYKPYVDGRLHLEARVPIRHGDPATTKEGESHVAVEAR